MHASRLPAQDVVYLLASSTSAAVLQQHEASLLEFYHQQLTQRLEPSQAAAFTPDTMRRHFQLALLDYVRFMAGWGFWGNVSWAKRRAREYLSELQQLVVQA